MAEHVNRIFFKGMNVVYDQSCFDRPVIVFLHDSLGCIELWRGFPRKLAELTKCNILVYDRLGHGKSDSMSGPLRPVNYMELEADLLKDLLTELRIEKAILFGHGDGGTIALITASKYPQNIRAVISEAAHVFVKDVTLKEISQVMEIGMTTNLSKLLAKYHGNKVETIFRAWTETWARGDYRSWNIEHHLREIACPLLFIQGETDEDGILEQTEKTIRQIRRQAQKIMIPNVGHTRYEDATLELCRGFIRSLQ